MKRGGGLWEEEGEEEGRWAVGGRGRGGLWEEEEREKWAEEEERWAVGRRGRGEVGCGRKRKGGRLKREREEDEGEEQHFEDLSLPLPVLFMQFVHYCLR
ncbi:hypothetical protein EYF80_062909 [Liparis tanakae]|uniref:Uncharacterized protein n=1 Tax=Liparis tanakae TaxID=230148 RepID=A0A4Z2EDX2_9TELE|nr:hypothetical protein EYF80_062909 [Liparis tanakae]